MTPNRLLRAMDATWPAAFCYRAGPWTVREGQGGGQRVSAATPAGDWTPDDIPLAEAAMQALHQAPLFMLRPEDTSLDALLDARGYAFTDEVALYAANCTRLADPPPDPMTTFPHWPPLAIARDLWSDAGIGAARLCVMDRTRGPKTVILGRARDRAAGVAFVACDGDTAMLHALEVTPALRRHGVARAILRAAAAWALTQGSIDLSLAVTAANGTARTLYASQGMQPVGTYHYRAR